MQLLLKFLVSNTWVIVRQSRQMVTPSLVMTTLLNAESEDDNFSDYSRGG